MKSIVIMTGLILVGIILIASSKTKDNSRPHQAEDEWYGDLIGQEALKHL